MANWFEQGGDAYARHRPDYPAELAAFLASVAPDRALAVDVGCGNGQFTRSLAAHFESVVGSDPSADQIAHAEAAERVRYVVGSAERIDLADASASLITAAQAAHWFDRPRFYDEVRRIAKPGCVVALVSYGVMRLGPELDPRFQAFYADEIGPYWPPERRLVDEGYATIDFPFRALPYPPMEIVRDWAIGDFLGYLSTWSAARQAEKKGRGDLAESFAREIAALWGAGERRVTWPINMRLGMIE